MRWAKSRPAARFSLALSNVIGCTDEDLPGLLDRVPYNGENPEGYRPLVDAIAKRYGVRPENVALGTGCSGVNFLACAALLRAGDDALVETPGYDPLPAAAHVVGARVITFERRFEDGWSVDPACVGRLLTDRTRLIILSSPHNPTGAAATGEALRALGDLAERRNAWVLVDEVYRDAALTPLPQTASQIHPRCITTSSLTKVYGLPGLRCGWAVGAEEVIGRIRRMRDAVDAVGAFPMEMASSRVFDVIDTLRARAKRIIEPNFRRLRDFMKDRTDLAWVPPDGGTVAFPRLQGVADADPFVDRLLREFDTAVVPGRFFGAPPHFRIGFGIAAETFAGGLDAIARALGG
ncbi:MAG: pyridoxal phosphate-dependent aminotransferase [bacterium]